MTCGHVLVASVDGIGARELAVLLVHVVSTGARVITDPDAKVLDDEWLLLTDLNTGHRTEVSQRARGKLRMPGKGQSTTRALQC